MDKKYKKIRYDKEADILSIELSPSKKIDYASEIGDFIVHFSNDNNPVLVEVLNASAFIRQGEKTIATATPVSA